MQPTTQAFKVTGITNLLICEQKKFNTIGYDIENSMCTKWLKGGQLCLCIQSETFTVNN